MLKSSIIEALIVVLCQVDNELIIFACIVSYNILLFVMTIGLTTCFDFPNSIVPNDFLVILFRMLNYWIVTRLYL